MARDYYEILGVLPSAEDIVIRAAYKALAQRYHPDKWQGDPQEASRRMAELNEAYGVLSDPARRTQYDRTREDATAGDEIPGDEESINSAFESALKEREADWKIALEFVPELAKHQSELERLSKPLAFAFRQIMLANKNFADCEKVAAGLEEAYLKTYFGGDKAVQRYAKHLILRGDREISRELNKVVKVLGSNVPPMRIILRLHLKHAHPAVSRTVREKLREVKSDISSKNITELIASLGGKIIRDWNHDGYSIEILGETIKTVSPRDTEKWAVETLIPALDSAVIS